MAEEFEITSLPQLRFMIAVAPNAAMRGAKRAMQDALDDWVRESRDIAPIDTGLLRRGIKGDGVKEKRDEVVAKISSVAIEGDFNYAYYIHEEDAGGAEILSGEKQYLDVSAQENYDKWLGWIEEEIKKEFRRGGW